MERKRYPYFSIVFILNKSTLAIIIINIYPQTDRVNYIGVYIELQLKAYFN